MPKRKPAQPAPVAAPERDPSAQALIDIYSHLSRLASLTRKQGNSLATLQASHHKLEKSLSAVERELAPAERPVSQEVTAELAARIDELVKQITKQYGPRRLVRNKAGKPIGTEPIKDD